MQNFRLWIGTWFGRRRLHEKNSGDYQLYPNQASRATISEIHFSFFQSFIHSSVHPLSPSIRLSIYPCIHPSILRSFVCSSVRWFRVLRSLTSVSSFVFSLLMFSFFSASRFFFLSFHPFLKYLLCLLFVRSFVRLFPVIFYYVVELFFVQFLVQA